jgi:hypothetical protein
MIIWINGAFGVGKTSVARQIVARRRLMRLFDPEQVGFLLRRLRLDSGVDDFQDLPLWRELTIRLATEAAEPADLVVPMTVVHPPYLEEIVGGLSHSGLEVHHFTLTAPADTIRSRVRRRLDWPASRRWTLSRIVPCVAALADRAFATHIDAGRRSAREIADAILASVEGALPRAA